MSTAAPDRTRFRRTQPRTGSSRTSRRLLRGLVWLVWRQHRAAFLTGAVLLVALIAVIAQQRSGMVDFIHQHDLTSCAPDSVSAHCRKVAVQAGIFSGRYENNFNNASQAMLLIPLVLGVFLGAPMLARELENGTHRLVWTQSVSRTRWAVAKLGLPVALVAAGAGVLSWVYDWWWRSADGLFTSVVWSGDWPYNLIGPVPVALSVLALLVGITFGLFVRRPVVAMLLTFVTVGIADLALTLRLRTHLVPLMTAVSKNPTVTAPSPADGWSVDVGYITGSGRHLGLNTCHFLDEGAPTACYRQHNIVGQYAQYHGSSQLWPMQWAESGICLGVAALLAGLVVRRLARRPV